MAGQKLTIHGSNQRIEADIFPMKKTLFSTIAVAVISVIALSGCATVEKKQDGTNDFVETATQITSIPQWDKSSLSFLEQDGWKVESYQKYYLDNYNLGVPETFSVTSPDGKCNVFYGIDGLPDTDKGLDDNFLSEKYITSALEKYNASLIVSSNIDTVKTDTNSNLEMFSKNFTYNLPEVSNPDAPSGISGGSISARAFNTLVDNPYYTWQQVGTAKMLPVASINYTCMGQAIDTSVEAKIISNAKLSFAALPKTTGAPIAPTVQDKMKVGP